MPADPRSTPWSQSCPWTARPTPAPAWPGASTPTSSSANQYRGRRTWPWSRVVAKLVAAGFALRGRLPHLPGVLREACAATPSAGASRWPRCWAHCTAQIGLGVASIGGKDSMSGTFEQLDVPPTLVSFATAIGKAGRVVSPSSRSRQTASSCIRPDRWTPAPAARAAGLAEGHYDAG